MQRKNNLLKNRSGFAMIMAIFIILVIGTLMSLMISMSAQSQKRTVNLYLNEQAALLAKSATEYAMLAVSGYERNSTSGCINHLSITYPSSSTPIFDIDVKMEYIGFGSLPGCDIYNSIGTINTPDSNGTILMDVTVTSNEANLNIGETIRYHRRTLQKL
jgi:hypothetical protein